MAHLLRVGFELRHKVQHVRQQRVRGREDGGREAQHVPHQLPRAVVRVARQVLAQLQVDFVHGLRVRHTLQERRAGAGVCE